MQNPELVATERLIAPDIQCELLAPFDRANLESVRHAFQSATPVWFQQAWLAREETGFSPGVVRMGWEGNSLLVFAELTDTDISNGATKLNQRTWELGDVFEMFLHSPQKQGYVELHVTPNNQRLQLGYPNQEAAEWARKADRLDEFLISGEAFRSLTWIENEKSRWHVYAEIPTLAVCGSNEDIANTRWRFSFGRYDYTRDIKPPVISSTSFHAKSDFHRQHEWGVMTFQNRL